MTIGELIRACFTLSGNTLTVKGRPVLDSSAGTQIVKSVQADKVQIFEGNLTTDSYPMLSGSLVTRNTINLAQSTTSPRKEWIIFAYGKPMARVIDYQPGNQYGMKHLELYDMSYISETLQIFPVAVNITSVSSTYGFPSDYSTVLTYFNKYTLEKTTPNISPLYEAQSSSVIATGTTGTITGTKDTYSITVNKENADVTYNGNPVSGSTISVGDNGALNVSGTPAKITSTVDANIDLKINGAQVSTGNVVSVLGESNTLQAVNTKPTPTVTFTFDGNVEVSINEVQAVSGQAYPLTENASVMVAVEAVDPSTLTVSYSNMQSITIDGNDVTNGQTLTLAPGSHQLEASGATAIPAVSLNGEGVTQFSVNGADFATADLPYTFTPQAGRTNSIYVTGTADTSSKTVTISGTHIGSITVNNQLVNLPYTVNVTEPLDISVSGEIYQLDVSSKGGAIVSCNGVQLSDGEHIHTIIDVNADQYLKIDGTHKLTVSGEDIKTITVNGVSVDVSTLPVVIDNNNMTASVIIGGYPPSEIHVSGLYIDTVSLDGNAVPVGANGSVDLEVEVRDENHFLTVVGSQPRAYNLTFDNGGNATDIEVNGVEMADGQVLPITDSKYISATPNPVPVNFDTDEFAIVEIDGRPYTGDFQVNLSHETFVDVNSSSCVLTIDYGDNSYQITVPQKIVAITAPHRDGWIFDTWTSNDIGIISPRMVQCNLDLTGHTSAHLVANYQRYITCDKPNPWN